MSASTCGDEADKTREKTKNRRKKKTKPRKNAQDNDCRNIEPFQNAGKRRGKEAWSGPGGR